MHLVLLDAVEDIRSDVGEDMLDFKGGSIDDSAKVCSPSICQRDDDNYRGRDLTSLIVSDVVEVQRLYGLNDVLNGDGRPKELENDSSPNSGFGWAIEQEVNSGFNSGRAYRAQWGGMHLL